AASAVTPGAARSPAWRSPRSPPRTTAAMRSRPGSTASCRSLSTCRRSRIRCRGSSTWGRPMDADPGVARILVVDDHAPNIRLLEAILVPRGYDIVPADSGEAALARLADESVDLVLLDVVMPGIDGYEVCSRLRSREET